MSTLPPYVRLQLQYTTKPNVGGTCNVMVDVIQPLDPTAPIVPLDKPVTLQLPGLPVAMGKLVTSGGITDDDEARKVADATNGTRNFWMPPAGTVSLTGILDHADGKDWGDYGRFWFTRDGSYTHCGEHHQAENVVAFVYACTDAPKHEKEKWVLTSYCFLGQYMDGGPLGTTAHLPMAKTCADVNTYEPQDPKLRFDLCELDFTSGWDINTIPLDRLPPAVENLLVGIGHVNVGNFETTCEWILAHRDVGDIEAWGQLKELLDSMVDTTIVDNAQNVVNYVKEKNPVDPVDPRDVIEPVRETTDDAADRVGDTLACPPPRKC